MEEGENLEDGDYLLFTDRIAPGGVRSLRLVMPIYSTEANGERLGTLVANVRLKHLFPEDLAAERFGSKGELAVIGSEDGEILFHTRPELVGRDIQQADSRLADLVEAHGGDDPVPEPWTRLSGGSGKRLASAEKVSEVPWVVFATAVPREFEAEARTAGVINLTVALLAILFAFTVLLYSSGRISHSIKELTVGAREIQTGNLSHAIRVQTHDEIQTLGEAFNAMTASLRESIALREKAARELEALNRTLEDRVHERTRELRSLNSALETANQELKELDRLKSQFLATVSHEFRTPLTSIKAFSEILLDEVEPEPESPQIRRFLGIINAESDRLGRLIKNLLNMSRLESGRMVWRMSVFPLKDVVEAAVDSLIPAFQEKNLEVIRQHECPDVRVRVDRDRIQEVVTNLLENAVKFSDHDGRIWVSCVMEPPEGNGGPRVRVSVRDEGCGIPPGHLEKIFDRFSQVDASDTRARGGPGWGSPSARKSWIITADGSGRKACPVTERPSTSPCRWRRRTRATNPRTRRALTLSPPAGASPGRRNSMAKKVLVCDDEPYIVESVSYVVRKAGYEVVMAEDGVEALTMARQERPDLIFLDIMMPRLSGQEVCRQLKQDPDTKGAYIVMLTARGQEEDERRAMEMGADEFMTKPFSPRKMRAKLQEVLGEP